jgi:hypothetical protein
MTRNPKNTGMQSRWLTAAAQRVTAVTKTSAREWISSDAQSLLGSEYRRLFDTTRDGGDDGVLIFITFKSRDAANSG